MLIAGVLFSTLSLTFIDFVSTNERVNCAQQRSADSRGFTNNYLLYMFAYAVNQGTYENEIVSMVKQSSMQRKDTIVLLTCQSNGKQSMAIDRRLTTEDTFFLLLFCSSFRI